MQPALYWGKPVTVLINERSFSDAEVFPYCFQVLELGKVVGVPTPGGVIGTNDITLSDGSTFRIPHVGYYGLDGTNLERFGVQPDVLVIETPKDRAEGRDPQLDRAVDVLLEDIRAYEKAQKAKIAAMKKKRADRGPEDVAEAVGDEGLLRRSRPTRSRPTRSRARRHRPSRSRPPIAHPQAQRRIHRMTRHPADRLRIP